MFSDRLVEADVAFETVERLGRSSDPIVAATAYRAASLRDDVSREWLEWAFRRLNRAYAGEVIFLLQAIERHGEPPFIARVLARANVDWGEGWLQEVVGGFVERRVRAGERPTAAEFEAALLAEMYLAWAQARGMQAEVLESDDADRLLAVSGLGCGQILADEGGLHILEVVEQDSAGERETGRLTALVDVVPRLSAPPGGRDDLIKAAWVALSRAPSPTRVVRRYRFEPDPLVRDSVRGYRTGRVDRVLAGNFDLF